MVQDKLADASVLDKYRQRATKRKGRQSIDILPSTKGSDARANKGSVDPSHKFKKRSRDGGNIATTTQSPGSLTTHPPRRETVEVDSPPPRRMEQATPPPKTDQVMEVSMSPIRLLGGDL